MNSHTVSSSIKSHCRVRFDCRIVCEDTEKNLQTDIYLYLEWISEILSSLMPPYLSKSPNYLPSHSTPCLSIDSLQYSLTQSHILFFGYCISMRFRVHIAHKEPSRYSCHENHFLDNSFFNHV